MSTRASSLRGHQLRTQVMFLGVAVLVIATIFGGAGWIASHQLLAQILGKHEVVHVGPQVETAAAKLPADDLRVYRKFSAAALDDDAPLVLSYHDIEEHPKSPFAITPARFEQHMAMLAEAGFRTVTAAQFAAYLEGQPLPRRSLVITFDDGTAGLWTYGDKILQRYGFHGVSFVITGDLSETASSYYLTWSELQEMQSSGRWDVESHSSHGHGFVKTDAHGAQGPFFVNRKWLPAQHRLETVAEFRARITHDLQASKDAIEAHDLPTPLFFAHPFSPRARDSDDPAAALPVLGAVTATEFRGDFINDDFATQVRTRVAGTPMPRLEVVGSESARTVFDSVARTIGVPVTDEHPFSTPERWVDDSGRPLASGFAGDQLMLPIGSGTYARGHLAPGSSAQWQSYTTEVRIEGLGEPGSGGSAGLTVHDGDAAAYQITISAARVSVRRGKEPSSPVQQEAKLQPNSIHTLAVTVHGGDVQVSVDGTVEYQGTDKSTPVGGIALSASRPNANVAVPVFYALHLKPVS